jgi:hypothetical protein
VCCVLFERGVIWCDVLCLTVAPLSPGKNPFAVQLNNNNNNNNISFDRLCGPVVRVHGYRSRGPGSIPGTTRFSDK